MIVKDKYFQIVDEVLKNDFSGKIAIDATIGNGHDTLKLLEVVGENGFVYGFDIQEMAINNTEKIISKKYNNYKLFLESHENIDLIESCDLIIYNLGYLPGSDKNKMTLAKSTLISLGKALKILNDKGIIIVVSYLGHENSKEEREAVDEFMKNINQKEFKVEKREFYNQKHNPPITYLIEKIGE
ncbi:class I SAM-dependent methyltransferase [Peptoniphilus sp. MSJ-1]|uniref:Class I SAM-dependent methyltransferase n=1 Tax=Peptoniphilus ovalis TaxID=2841503 RepID=A0ABS6FGS5_9FIRM|nr:class I SAM-dependent methyltransferase [Peptoniphilus ovalis]MBU5669169.1 class I SAM-dependent methyltransferase [Peptoniphilus ovalis]